MGSYASKLLSRYGEDVTEVKRKSDHKEELPPSTPVDARKTLPVDPRSASVGIPRTPIEVNCTPPNAGRRPVSAIPAYLQKKPYLETDLDNIGHLAPRKTTPLTLYQVDMLNSPILSNKASNTEKFEPPMIHVNDTSPGASPDNESETGGTPISELRYKILGIDPRSPAADFDRTPILAPKSMIRLKARSQENLSRRDSLFELGIANDNDNIQRLSYCETITGGNIPEVLALPEIIVNLNKARDFNETNTEEENSEQFDSCSSSSSTSESGSSVETVSYSGEEITVIPNPNVNNNSKSDNKFDSNILNNTLASSSERIEDSREIYYPAINSVSRVLSIAAGKTGKEQQVSDCEKKITVWRDSVSSDINETLDFNVQEEEKETVDKQKDVIVIPKEEIMIEFDDIDNEIINKPSKSESKKREEMVEESRTKKHEFGERRTKNNDNNEGKIFLQEKFFTPEGKNVNQTPKVRTPLGNRSNNHGKVNGSNMPMKSPQQLLRGKTMSTKLHQENTPPRSMKSKLNGTQWDPDSTVLI